MEDCRQHCKGCNVTQTNIYDFLDDPIQADLQRNIHTNQSTHLESIADTINHLLAKHPQLKDLIK